MRRLSVPLVKITVTLAVLSYGTFAAHEIMAAPKEDHGHEHEERSHRDHAAHDEHDDHQDEGGHAHSESKPVEFTEQMLARYSISIEKAGPAVIKHPLHLNGRVIANEDRVIHIVPRFSGIAKQVKKQLGDRVKKEEVLAIIESNESLQMYEVRSPIDGTVISKHIAGGEFVTESDHIFVAADLAEVWVDLYVFEPDFGKLKLGQSVLIRSSSRQFSAHISFVSSVVDEATQSKFVRAVVSNGAADLYPGQFVTADLFVEELSVPLAVRLSGLQSIEGKDVVFVRDGAGFKPSPLSLGKRDDECVQVLSGIEPGTEYAAGKTFILKAEHGKSEAEHEH